MLSIIFLCSFLVKLDIATVVCTATTAVKVPTTTGTTTITKTETTMTMTTKTKTSSSTTRPIVTEAATTRFFAVLDDYTDGWLDEIVVLLFSACSWILMQE